MVVRIDRLARSLSHLLEIVEALRAKGAYFRSINDPIDTGSPQGMLMTQMLGAFAEFERAFICERTRAGLKAAVARGARPGNPKMRARDPLAIDDLRRNLKEKHLHELVDGRHRWLPIVERLRPHLPWSLVLRHIQALKPSVRSFSERTLVKACRTLVEAGYADRVILEAAPRLPPDSRIAGSRQDQQRFGCYSSQHCNLVEQGSTGANALRGHAMVAGGGAAGDFPSARFGFDRRAGIAIVFAIVKPGDGRWWP